MTDTMAEGITFRREDADRITRMETLLTTIDSKLDTLMTGIANCQGECSTRREKFDKRVTTIEDQHKVEKGFLKGRKADVAVIISAVALISTLISIWAVIH